MIDLKTQTTVPFIYRFAATGNLDEVQLPTQANVLTITSPDGAAKYSPNTDNVDGAAAFVVANTIEQYEDVPAATPYEVRVTAPLDAYTSVFIQTTAGNEVVLTLEFNRGRL